MSSRYRGYEFARFTNCLQIACSPRHATPRHATTRHDTPRHATEHIARRSGQRYGCLAPPQRSYLSAIELFIADYSSRRGWSDSRAHTHTHTNTHRHTLTHTHRHTLGRCTNQPDPTRHEGSMEKERPKARVLFVPQSPG